jgi:hypothetical protein
MKGIAKKIVQADPKLEALQKRIEASATLDKASIGSKNVSDLLQSLLNLTAIPLTNMQFEFPDDAALQLTAQAAMLDQSLKITGTFTINEENFELTLNNFTADLSLTIKQLVELGLLPSGFKPEFLPNITIPGIQFIFDSSATSLTISSGPGSAWDFLGYGNLFVSDPKLSLIRNAASGLVSTTAVATGALASTDKKVNIPIKVSLPIGPGGWSAGLAAPITLDQGPALLDAILQTNVSSLLPDTFTDKLKTIELTAFYLSFDASQKSISSLQVIVNTKDDWVIIQDKLKLNKGINLTITASRTGEDPLEYNGSISATASVNYNDPSTLVEASAAIPIPLTGKDWTIRLGNSDQDMGLGRLVAIIPGVGAVLPKGLTEQLDKVVMKFLSISFRFGSGKGFAFTHVAFSIKSDETWQLPMLQNAVYLDELHFELDAALPYAATTTSGSLGGNIQIAGGEVTIPVAIAKTDADPNWLLNVTSDEIPLPSISSLADFMGADVLVSASPSGLMGIGNFSINDLELKWALGAGSKLELLAFTIQSTPGTPAWNLVPGYFELSELFISLNIENKSVSDKNISGAIGTTVTLVLNKDKDKKLVLGMLATKPSSAEPWNFAGTLKENLDLNELLLGLKLPADVVAILPALTVTQFDLAIEPTSGSFSTSMTIENTPENTWTIATIGNASITLEQLYFSIEHYAANTDLATTGSFNIGTDAKKCEVAVGATYKNKIWNFTGAFTNTEGLTINEVLKKYIENLDASTIPQLSIDNIKVGVEKGPTATLIADASYSLLDFFIDGTLTIPVINTMVITGAVTLHYDSRKEETKRYDGTSVKGTLKFGGLSFSVLASYTGGKFSNYVFELIYKNITARCEADTSDPEIVKFTFELKSTDPNKGLSLGDLISTLVGAATGETADIPGPWDFINNIPLDGFGFMFTYNKTDKSKTIGLTYKPGINLGFITIDELSLIYTPGATGDQGPVQFMVTKGTFLGLPLEGLADEEKPGWDLRNPEDAPKVPGLGDSAFKLENLSFGNQVAIKDAKPPKSVVQAITDLNKAFTGGDDGLPSTLYFDKNYGWLIGTQFTLIKYIDIALVFYDPVIYGVSINVKGGQFNGLSFQILYKKVTDNVGVFQIDLTLPDYVRQQQFGAVSVTLPSLSLSIYTNGDFLIDLGFPHNADFTRSFALEFAIFTGSGGFYFGKLSNDTATDFNLPKTNGQFNPVIAFGIGIKAGVGRSVDKGILKAGLSLTLTVILEGIIAKYEPNPSSGVVVSDDDAQYFRVKALAALVGRIYGEINFVIITASLDVTAKISATLLVEAFRQTLITFSASVSASVEVRINLGLFKITISCSFSATISDSFTIGSNDNDAPWDSMTLRDRSAYFTALDAPSPVSPPQMDWTAKMDYPKSRLNIIFLPQLSVKYKAGTSTTKQAVAVSLLYLNNTPGSGVDTDFTTLSRAMLAWTFNAYFSKNGGTAPKILDQQVTIADLNAIYAYLTQKKYTSGVQEPFGTLDLINYLFGQSFNAVMLNTQKESSPENLNDSDQSVAVFPMLPIFKMSITGQDDIDFLQYGLCDADYLEAVKHYFDQMKVQFNSEQQPAGSLKAADSVPTTLAEYLFADYFLMIARSGIQDAINDFKEIALSVLKDESLQDVAERFAHYGVSAKTLAFANRREPIHQGRGISVPSFTYRLCKGETAADLRARLPEVSNLLMNTGTGEGYVTVPAFEYVPANNSATTTLWSVTERFNLEFDDLLDVNLTRKGLFAPGTELLHAFTETKTVAQILDYLQKGNKFSLANIGATASRFALHGLRIPKDTAGTSRVSLYEATGQQIELTGITTASTVALSINEESVKPEWLQFEGTNETAFAFTQDMVNAIGEMEGSKYVPPLALDAQDDVIRYRLEAKTFTLPDGLQWQNPNPTGVQGNISETFIWKFPSKLQQYLNDNPNLPFELALQSRSTSFTLRDSESLTPLFWSTSIDVTIMQIPSPNDPKTLLEKVYGVLGCGDADGALLQQLITANPGIVNLDILFADNNAKKNDGKEVTGLVSNSLSEFKTFLLQTNYSTVSNPALFNTDTAEDNTAKNLVGMTAIDFLTYLWECSIVRSGGYYLYYDNGIGGGLPSYLFSEDGRATITILISYALQPESGTSAYVLPDFVNSVGINQKIEPKEDNLYVGVYLTSEQQLVFDPNLQTIISTVLPGTGLFRGYRINPALLKAADLGESADNQISELFNLIEYRINSTPGVFIETKFALPAGPVVVTESGTNSLSAVPKRALASDGWIYSSSMPIFPFTTPYGTAKDPYAANGKTATIYFNYLDIFGNTLFPDNTGDSGSGITQTITPGYVDPVIGLDQWVNLAKHYDIATAKDTGKPVLTINLALDGKRYENAQDPVAVAKRDLAFYQNVSYQLAQPDVVVTVESTIGQLLAPVKSPIEELRDYVAAIITFLNTVINGPVINKNTIITATPSFVIDIEKVNAELIFALVVNIGIKRTSNIDSQFTQEPGIRFADSVIPPDLYDNDNEEISALDRFATALEAALPVMKVAVGQAKPTAKASSTFAERMAVNGSSEIKNQEVWLIRYAGATGQTGISFNVDPLPAYFATRPLSTKLISRPDEQHPNPVPLRTYTSGSYLGDAATELKSYAGIDIEVLARVFVSAMDDFLSADTSTLAWHIQYAANLGNGNNPKETPFQIVEAAKKNVAAAIAQSQLSAILQGEDTSEIEQAIEALKQQLLITLGSVYTVDAVIQNKVTVTGGYNAPTANLYGQLEPSGKDVPNNTYNFTPVKIPLTKPDGKTDPSTLISLFSVRQETGTQGKDQNVDLIAEFKATLNYHITALEHDFGTPVNGYTPSSWLTFVHPIICAGADGAPLVNADIPIPLKAYPTPPSMVSQSGLGINNKLTLGDGKKALEHAQQWVYAFVYDYISAQQDSIYLNIRFNVQSPSLSTALVAELDLFEALIQFNASYNDVIADLVKNDANAVPALQSFAWMAQQVGNAWSGWFNANNALGKLATHELNFVIREFEGNEEGVKTYLMLELSAAATNPIGGPLPLVEISGFETRTYIPEINSKGTKEVMPEKITYYFVKVVDDTETPLLYIDRKEYSQRRVKLPKRTILADENAWAGVSIHRNEILTGKPTNTNFLYITPYIRFADLCLPSLYNETPINLADFTPGASKANKIGLTVFLDNFFKELLKEVEHPEIVLQLQCGYSYALQPEDAGTDFIPLGPTLPILLTAPINTSWDTPPPLIAEVAEAVKIWIQNHDAKGIAGSGKLAIILSLYSALTADQHNPVLKLNELFLNTDLIEFS